MSRRTNTYSVTEPQREQDYRSGLPSTALFPLRLHHIMNSAEFMGNFLQGQCAYSVTGSRLSDLLFIKMKIVLSRSIFKNSIWPIRLCSLYV